MKFILIYLLLVFVLPATAIADRIPFMQASPGYQLSFPLDHGQHRKYQTEWWYVTGVLALKKDSVFETPLAGFQLTFFRRRSEETSLESAYLAHAALTWLPDRTYVNDERLSLSSSAQVAGAADDHLHAWNYEWRLQQLGSRMLLDFQVPSSEVAEPTKVTLLAELGSPPVLQGEGGYSRKGDCATCASHYYSFPFLRVEGSITRNAMRSEVEGLAWYDHEFMSNALQDHQEGWDWFSLYHRDGRRSVFFQLRSDSAPYRYGATFSRGAPASALTPSEFSLTPLEHSVMQRSKTRYPTKWKITTETEELVVQAAIPNQEFESKLLDPNKPPLRYWEGLVRSEDGQALGYLEMTGYGKSGLPGL